MSATPKLFDSLPRQTKATDRHVAAARTAWGPDVPAWVIELALSCDRIGQVRTAALVGASTSVVNETVRKTYKGRLDNVEKRVQGALMGEKVQCPVVGEIGRHRCLANQRKPFSDANPTRVALHRECPKCRHYRAPAAPDQAEGGAHE